MYRDAALAAGPARKQIDTVETARRYIPGLKTGVPCKIRLNSNGLLSKVSLPDSTSVSYGYTDGLLTSVTDPAGKSSSYAYDAEKRLSSYTDPAGSTVRNTSRTAGSSPRRTRTTRPRPSPGTAAASRTRPPRTAGCGPMSTPATFWWRASPRTARACRTTTTVICARSTSPTSAATSPR